MPATRSSPRKSASSSSSSSSPAPHHLVCTAPSDRRLLLITDPQLAATPIDHFTSITLTHPKHRTPARYLLIGQRLLECQTVTPPQPRSALAGDWVLGRAGLVLATAVDPLLLALPVLSDRRGAGGKEGREGYFLSYDALFAEEGARFPVAVWDAKTRPFHQLHHVCDVRDGWDEPVYRLNDAKALAYLTAKLDHLAPVLPTLPSTAAHPNPQHLALGLLSEYMDAGWFERLCGSLGLGVDAVLKRGKAAQQQQPDGAGDGEVEVVGADGLTERSGGGQRVEKEKKKGVSAAVKKLQKASSGTKSISSFFGKK